MLIMPNMISRKETNRIIFHHSASKTEGVNIAVIRQWHIARGFEDIGYHQIILPDGTIENGRAKELIGAHSAGRNIDSIGICLIGDFNKHEPTNFQIESSRAIYYSECKRYDKKLIIEFHREINEENPCPGRLLNRNIFTAQLLFNNQQLKKREGSVDKIKKFWDVLNGKKRTIALVYWTLFEMLSVLPVMIPEDINAVIVKIGVMLSALGLGHAAVKKTISVK